MDTTGGGAKGTHVGLTEEQMRQNLDSFLARNRSKKALQTNPQYKELLKAHKDIKERIETLEGIRMSIWHEIQEIRDQAYQQELWNLNHKEDT